VGGENAAAASHSRIHSAVCNFLKREKKIQEERKRGRGTDLIQASLQSSIVGTVKRRFVAAEKRGANLSNAPVCILVRGLTKRTAQPYERSLSC